MNRLLGKHHESCSWNILSERNWRGHKRQIWNNKACGGGVSPHLQNMQLGKIKVLCHFRTEKKKVKGGAYPCIAGFLWPLSFSKHAWWTAKDQRNPRSFTLQPRLFLILGATNLCYARTDKLTSLLRTTSPIHDPHSLREVCADAVSHKNNTVLQNNTVFSWNLREFILRTK